MIDFGRQCRKTHRLTDDPRSQCCRQDYVLIVHAMHQVFGVLGPHHLNPFCKWGV